MKNIHDESTGKRSALVASLVAIGIAWTVDSLVGVFTGWYPTLWTPPLSDSFVPVLGIMIPASPGLFIGLAVVLVLWLRGNGRVEDAA